MKQQAGIGIILALTTAMCWGALPIAMKQVLEVMEPPTGGVLPLFDGKFWSWRYPRHEKKTAPAADFSQAAVVGTAGHCDSGFVR